MSNASLFSLLCLLTFIVAHLPQSTEGAYCHGHPKADAHKNLLPFIENKPTLIKSTKNGKLFHLSSDSGDDALKILHVYGSAYEMGYAHGELLADELKPFIGAIWEHVKEEIAPFLSTIPKWISDLIVEYGLEVALDLTYEIMSPHVAQYFMDELKGLSDGSGVNYKLIRRIHFIGELTQGKCSMLGAWNSATVNGTTIQLRAFDWDTKGPFKDHPSIVVYHPNEGNNFANIGFIGWIGSFSGMSDQKMAISEIGVAFPDESFGKETRWGIPFVFLLRDILQWDKTLDDSINRITSAARTCDLILGVGDGKMGAVRAFSYSYSQARVFDDMNLEPNNSTWHPRIRDTVYYGMDWNCPPYSQRLSERISANHGKIDAEVVARDLAALTATGNLQVSIYDLSHNYLYLAIARRSDVTQGEVYAYDRPYFKIDMSTLWDEPQAVISKEE